MIVLVLALQEVPAKIGPPAMLDIAFDLSKTPRSSAAPGDIVVTGRRIDNRLHPLPEVHEELLPKAQIGLGGGKLGITTEAAPMIGGVSSNRIMLKWKLKF